MRPLRIFSPPSLFLPWLVSLILGIAIIFYRGPGWHFTRASLGDVIAVAFLYFTISLFWKSSPLWRATTTGLIALAIECAQFLHLMPEHPSFIEQIFLGSSFDAMDLVAYTAGIIIAIGIERWMFCSSTG